jgi:type VI secretion system protein ImpH
VTKSPLDALRDGPHKFRFDAAFRLLTHARPGPNGAAGEAGAQSGPAEDDDSVRFTSPALLSQPISEITKVDMPDASHLATRLTSPLIGLIGPSGVMPRWYTELVAQSVRVRSRAIADFLDMLAQRLIGAFARAGIKYRLHRAAEAATHHGTPEKIGEGILAFTGYGTAHLADRLAAGPDVLKHYSGFFAARPRSSDRLASMVSDYLGRKVEIIEFAGAWLTVPPDQQSCLPRGRSPGAFTELGVNVAIGTRAWDQQARFIVRVGPLNRREFEQLLPDQPKLRELVSLIRAYVGWEADFAIKLVLAVPEIPPLQMAEAGFAGAPRLGWTSWVPSATGAIRGRNTVDDATFGATLVESLS